MRRGVVADARLYLRLRGVVWVVSVVVFARHSGLYTRGVEEAAQLLLLALSQAVDDATRLLLLLRAHTHTQTWSVCSEAGCMCERMDRLCLCVIFFYSLSGETDRPYAFQALLEPHAYRLFGNLFFNGVLQLFPGQ